MPHFPHRLHEDAIPERSESAVIGPWDPASFVRRRKNDDEICRGATRYNTH